MNRLPHIDREAAEDIYFGQVVIIWARWFVILAAAILALWSSNDTGDLARRAFMVIGLMGVNFFLHGRSLMERPANQGLLIVTSAIDITVIGLMVAFWGEHGLRSQLYVLYYPVLFAFALVFASRITAVYSLIAIASYVVICFVANPDLVATSIDAKALAMRVITLAATAALGTYYWRIQRGRRRDAISRDSGLPVGAL